MTSQGVKLAIIGGIWWVGIFTALSVWGVWGLLAVPVVLTLGVFLGDRA